MRKVFAPFCSHSLHQQHGLKFGDRLGESCLVWAQQIPQIHQPFCHSSMPCCSMPLSSRSRGPQSSYLEWLQSARWFFSPFPSILLSQIGCHRVVNHFQTLRPELCRDVKRDSCKVSIQQRCFTVPVSVQICQSLELVFHV